MLYLDPCNVPSVDKRAFGNHFIYYVADEKMDISLISVTSGDVSLAVLSLA